MSGKSGGNGIHSWALQQRTEHVGMLGSPFLAPPRMPSQIRKLLAAKLFFRSRYVFHEHVCHLSAPVNSDRSIKTNLFWSYAHLIIFVYCWLTQEWYLPFACGFGGNRAWESGWYSVLGPNSSFPENGEGFLPNTSPLSFRMCIWSHHRWLVLTPCICLISQKVSSDIRNIFWEQVISVSGRAHVFPWHGKKFKSWGSRCWSKGNHYLN